MYMYTEKKQPCFSDRHQCCQDDMSTPPCTLQPIYHSPQDGVCNKLAFNQWCLAFIVRNNRELIVRRGQRRVWTRCRHNRGLIVRRGQRRVKRRRAAVGCQRRVSAGGVRGGCQRRVRGDKKMHL